MKKEYGVYGYLAGITNAAILQPLQNIKMALMLAPKDLKLSNNFLSNFWRASQYLWKQQKIAGLYKGLVPNVLKTGFSSAVYFCALRTLQNEFTQKNAYTSFICSSMARIASAITANPFGVIETRFQMASQNRWKGSMVDSFRKVYKVEGIHGFFKGLMASCIKEGTFAGIYYALYTEGKKLGLSSMASGMTSGMISTVLTHPFEIIRASLQVQILIDESGKRLIRMPIGNQLMALIRDGEMLKGVAPRLIKKPLANTLAFLIFEAMQKKEE